MSEQPKKVTEAFEEQDARADEKGTARIVNALSADLPEQTRRDVQNNPVLLQITGKHASDVEMVDTEGDGKADEVIDKSVLGDTHRRAEVVSVAAGFVAGMQDKERAHVLASNPVLATALREKAAKDAHGQGEVEGTRDKKYEGLAA